MNTKPSPKTQVAVSETIREEYIIKTFWIFSWHETIKSDSIRKDLVIETEENYDKIFINGVEITKLK